jgi:hypothetical protein
VPVDPFTVPEIVTGVVALTSEVEIVKLEETVAPAATGTEAGADATAGLELTRLTVTPPGGAGLPNVIVFAVTGSPPSVTV